MFFVLRFSGVFFFGLGFNCFFGFTMVLPFFAFLVVFDFSLTI